MEKLCLLLLGWFPKRRRLGDSFLHGYGNVGLGRDGDFVKVLGRGHVHLRFILDCGCIRIELNNPAVRNAFVYFYPYDAKPLQPLQQPGLGRRGTKDLRSRLPNPKSPNVCCARSKGANKRTKQTPMPRARAPGEGAFQCCVSSALLVCVASLISPPLRCVISVMSRLPCSGSWTPPRRLAPILQLCRRSWAPLARQSRRSAWRDGSGWGEKQVKQGIFGRVRQQCRAGCMVDQRSALVSCRVQEAWGRGSQKPHAFFFSLFRQANKHGKSWHSRGPSRADHGQSRREGRVCVGGLMSWRAWATERLRTPP